MGMLNGIKMLGIERMNNSPTLIGETGIPFDLSNGKAFYTHDYSEQISALDHTISCLEDNLLSYTLWCYTTDNDHMHGDQWNKENFSIIGPNSCTYSEGGRAVEAFVRPFAMSVNGIPMKSAYDRKNRCYELQFRSIDNKDDSVNGEDKKMENASLLPVPTEVYFPTFLFCNVEDESNSCCYSISTSDGAFEIQSKDGWDVILYFHDEGVECHHFVLSLHPSVMIRSNFS